MCNAFVHGSCTFFDQAFPSVLFHCRIFLIPCTSGWSEYDSQLFSPRLISTVYINILAFIFVGLMSIRLPDVLSAHTTGTRLSASHRKSWFIARVPINYVLFSDDFFYACSYCIANSFFVSILIFFPRRLNVSNTSWFIHANIQFNSVIFREIFFSRKQTFWILDFGLCRA